MTSSVELEAAATRIREVANTADLLSRGVETISTHSLPEFADHVTLWQPKAARAVADWLTDRASTLRVYGDADRTPDNEPALRLARIINDWEPL